MFTQKVGLSLVMYYYIKYELYDQILWSALGQDLGVRSYNCDDKLLWIAAVNSANHCSKQLFSCPLQCCHSTEDFPLRGISLTVERSIPCSYMDVLY